MSIKVFYCYAHEDKSLRVKLEKHLGTLKRQELITGWSDRNIDAGKEWVKEINTNLNRANIILLLISPHFVHSDYCYSIEMMHALERHKQGTARVIPILLRPVDYEGAPFSDLQALPTGAIPVTDRRWHNHDEAFYDVAQGIRKVVNELLSKQWVEEGNIHLYREQYEEALSAFQRALFFDLANALAHVGLGQTLLQLASFAHEPFDDENYYQKALAAFEQAIHLDETNAEAYVGKAQALRGDKGEEEGPAIINICERAIGLDPKNVDAYTLQGDVYTLAGLYEAALTEYEKAIDVDTFFNRHAWNSKGDVLYKLERYTEAITAYGMVMQACPKHAYAYKGNGDALIKLERYTEALAVYEQVLSLDSAAPALIHIQIGNILYQLKRYREALVAYDQALQPEYYLPSKAEAEAYRGKAKVWRSLAEYVSSKANELDPDHDPFLDYPESASKKADELDDRDPFLDYPDGLS